MREEREEEEEEERDEHKVRWVYHQVKRGWRRRKRDY